MTTQHTRAMFGITFALSAFALGSCSLDDLLDEPVEGAWYGLLTQSRLEYDVCMDIVAADIPGEAAGTIDYPDLNCGGDLTYEGKRDGVYRFREDITYGSCADNGRIEVSLVGGALRWRWFTRTGVTVLASGTLTATGSCQF